MSIRKVHNAYCALDVICFVLVGFANLLLHVTNIQPSKRGFHCDDESITMPFREETISTLTALFVGLALGVLTIIVCEILRHFVFKFKPRGAGRDNFYIKLGPITLKAWQRRILFLIFMFGFGAVVANLFTDAGKLLIGRLRPYFLAVCKPDFSKVNCSAGKFITEDICTGDKKQITEARMSFPSGHSTFSMYCTVFVAMYLETAIPTRKTTLFKPLLQISVIMLGVLCALSRIFDYWHHWGDVLTGMALGTLVATFIVFKPLSLFSSNAATEYDVSVRQPSDVEAVQVQRNSQLSEIAS
ncbi:phospholipid phosphatase 1-like [Actinia tenebrosa]|uniref:Phospholipid phosphatase 1-like n=1 Tax=Actinia tenebrosa TaxID=6105 RepID=A0A6P8J4S6_ACTTE|nr:phospholipid phosphatase 1-like [Actinia tenebrosa]XP_031574650.1 phospholipid phosphatase 1-like [Actinia tenebrosa]